MDHELLDRYARTACHDAFAELVRRHLGLVRAAALRQTHDAALADDVTQAVMIVLARKAATIRPDAVLASWLFSVTRHAAQNAMKIQARQRYHERRAAAGRAQRIGATTCGASELREVMDEAIARLPELERSGVLLHFFHDQSHEQVGRAIGLSGEAARKRVTRALEKMRTFLAGRGVTVSGAAVLMAALRAEAAAAIVPEAFTTSTVNVALLSLGSGSTSTIAGSLAIARGVTRMITLAKLKVAASIALVVSGVAGAASIPLFRHLSPPVATLVTVTAAAPATAPAQAVDGQYIAQVTGDVRIEFLGVSPYPGDEGSWFSIAGEPIDVPDARLLEQDVRTDTPPEHQIAMRIHRPPGTVVLLRLDAAMMASNSATDDGGEEVLLVSRFVLQKPSDTVSLRLGVSSADWTTIASADDLTDQVEVDAAGHGQFGFLPPDRDDLMGGAKVDVHHQTLDIPSQLIAIDEAGKEHVSNNVNVNNTNGDTVTSFSFDLEPEQIKRVRFQVREFEKFVDVTGITLAPDHKTQPKISVTDAKK